MKIIVVDDEPDVQFLFKQRFRREIRKEEIEFNFFLSAGEVINYLSTTDNVDIVLILSYINMPGMNGLELLKIIKEKTPEQKVFMITAYSDEHNYKTAVEYGADDYLTKPLDFSGLKEKILSL
ncbi:MAG: response regulator [Candidatus Poribacteria bacterium]|nr:response regulator [Candidatus Poribacteria bacterium]